MTTTDSEMEALYENARVRRKAGDYEAALRAFERILERRPDSAKLWEEKGDTLTRLNRHENAHSAYAQAAKLYLSEENFSSACRCYGHRIARHIFSIEAKEKHSRDLKKIAKELNERAIPAELRHCFHQNAHSLSEAAKVEKIREGRRGSDGKWRIKDGLKVYCLDQEYDEIYVQIENSPVPASYYCKHAVLMSSSCVDSAIGDMNRAIELDPDRGAYHRYRADFLLKKLWERSEKESSEKISDSERKAAFQKVAEDYRNAVATEPQNPDVWLKLIELDILQHNWDDAVGTYGSSKPYIQSRKDELIRSWLGCTALLLAGDAIEEGDRRDLDDQTIRLGSASAATRVLSDSFINQIRHKKELDDRWEDAVEVHKLFLAHLDDWDTRGDLLERLECHHEAVGAYRRAVETKPNYEIYRKMGEILGKKLNQLEDAFQAYESSIAVAGGCLDAYRLWYEKAEILEKLERHQDALDAYRKVEELNSSFYSFCHLWKPRALLLQKLGQNEAALLLYDDGIKNGDILEAWDQKIGLLRRTNHCKEADEELEKATAARSARAAEFYKLACESAVEGEKSDVFWRLRNAVELDAKYKEEAKKDAVFERFWADGNFIRIIG